ncbi:MAG: lipoprotein signal peptidase [Cyclobacteriaceae bacterium]|nr:lipoprotein signal peptidase [Cyclobacteriaceae bacterium HetDA_MAG_MS6]
MKEKSSKVIYFYLVSLLVIVIDQIVKLIVHFNMQLGSRGQIKIFGDWFKLHYLTNPGMAFGMELPFDHAKIILTLFRLGAMVAIGYYLYYTYKKGAATGLLVCIGMILGGAIGNLLDSIFYGVFLDNAPYDAPTPWFYGQVVDMFYIDIWEGRLPEWIPLIGGDYMALWPVFNVADASIFLGISAILIWQKKFFKETNTKNVAVAAESSSTEVRD